MDYISFTDSPLGRMIMSSDGTELTGLWFEDQRLAAYSIARDRKEAELPIFGQTRRWLDIYYSGRIPDFTPSIKLVGTPFRMSVWERLRGIPYGESVSYGELASSIAEERGTVKMSAQAVGGAVGHNPISIIVPCHRVLGAGGKLVGYGGGLERKIALLKIENIDFSV